MLPYMGIIDCAESNLKFHLAVSNALVWERATCVANENMLDQGNVHPAAWNMGKILSRDKLKAKINLLILDCTRGKLIRDSSLCGSKLFSVLSFHNRQQNLPSFEGIRNSSKIGPCFSVSIEYADVGINIICL